MGLANFLADEYGAKMVMDALEANYPPGVVLVAGIVVHLAAAGLRLREIHGVAQPFQHRDDSLSRGRKKRVVIARDK